MDISSFARCAAYAAFGFACGGVMFCRFMPLLLAKKDITKLSSDGNPGSANVFINCGIPLGLLCLFLDMFKGFLPVLLLVLLLLFSSIRIEIFCSVSSVMDFRLWRKSLPSLQASGKFVLSARIYFGCLKTQLAMFA